MVRIPVERVKIWLCALPKRVLPGVVLWIDHGTVYSTIKRGQEERIDTISRYSNGGKLLCPRIHRGRMCRIEVKVRDFRLSVAASLFATDEAKADPG